MLLTRRRTFLGGLLALVAAPAIVRASSLMPIQPLLVPENVIVQVRTRILGPPRCDHCFAAWGMCSHTGGPLDLDDHVLDHRVVELACESPLALRTEVVSWKNPGWT
jgi:hypothetical protein